MNKLQSIFQRALDAIVGMSKLAAEVEVLRSQVAQLTDDAERLRRANAGLDESLYQARNQRLDLERKLAEAEQAKATAQRESNDHAERANKLNDMLQSTLTDLDRVKHDKDTAEYEVLELQDKLKAAEAKVAAIHTALGIVPTPEVVTPPPPTGPVVQQPTEAATPPTPEPVPTAPEPTPPEPEIDWSRPTHWDAARSRYVND